MSFLHLLHRNCVPVWDQKTGVLFPVKILTRQVRGHQTEHLKGVSMCFRSSHREFNQVNFGKEGEGLGSVWSLLWNMLGGWNSYTLNISSRRKTIMTNSTQLEEVIGGVKSSRGYWRLCFLRKKSCVKIEWFVNPQRRRYIGVKPGFIGRAVVVRVSGYKFTLFQSITMGLRRSSKSVQNNLIKFLFVKWVFLK